jgi:hypothetical protein
MGTVEMVLQGDNSRGSHKDAEFLDIEQEGDHISILDDVILAFRPEQTSFARFGQIATVF